MSLRKARRQRHKSTTCTGWIANSLRATSFHGRCGSMNYAPCSCLLQQSRIAGSYYPCKPLPRRALFRCELQQLAAWTVGQNVDRTILEHAHVADALIHVSEQCFLFDHLVVLAQADTEERSAAQPADEDARLPLGEQI